MQKKKIVQASSAIYFFHFCCFLVTDLIINDVIIIDLRKTSIFFFTMKHRLNDGDAEYQFFDKHTFTVVVVSRWLVLYSSY